ncbi:hypothetical protein HHK36_033098 [Tetracentron sinense]|uniref:non-specific serine/threonine protein kinase n=1 Tax=Tetracentron sinense TaxID=13715 RepID=A0A835CZU5_TETSI|nr:hypothetical protein HHK36_033098 [Tetracentron sinense]
MKFFPFITRPYVKDSAVHLKRNSRLYCESNEYGPYASPPEGSQHWQPNAPPLADHVVTVVPKPFPLTGVASRPPHLPPPFSSSNGGSENPLPPPSAGIALGFSKSTFTYEELSVATDGFSNANLLGQGGFGFVSRGILSNGREVAVKQMKAGSKQGEREFQAEVEIISRVHHKHLVTLVGYCITGAQRLFVYEFVPNNTLEFHLHGHPKIIHRDIKTANILLDFKFEAKVTDFGLAKFSSDTNSHVSTRARPLLTRALEDGNFVPLVDPRLQKDYNPKEMACMVACAAACVRHSTQLRPRMSQIVRALEGDMPQVDLNEGIIPGHSTVNIYRNSDYDTRHYNEDMKKFRNIALESQ